MHRFDDPNTPAPGAADQTAARVRELEAENARLRAQVEQLQADRELDRQELEWYHALGLPLTEAEMLERAKAGPTISNVIAECEREYRK